MIVGLLLLVTAALIAGRLLVSARGRVWSWVMVVLVLGCAHLISLGEDPIVRMVVLCTALLAAMKGMVYAEWADPQYLSWGRYVIFALLWFGMDPGTFRRRQAGLTWKPDVMWGLLMMAAGTAGAWVVWMMGWRQVLVMFLPMSLGFHFGALRVLKGAHRYAGFPVRTLFPNLLKAKGLADFWSRRWNVGYSQMMQRVVGRPVANRLGRGGGVMAVFFVSGILHEVAIAVPVQVGWGLPTLYFAIHGGMALLEETLGFQFGRVVTLLLVMLPLGLLFPQGFQEEVIVRCLGIFELIE